MKNYILLKCPECGYKEAKLYKGYNYFYWRCPNCKKSKKIIIEVTPHNKIPKIDLSQIPILEEILRLQKSENPLISEHLCRRYIAIPIKITDDGTLIVAIGNLSDIFFALDDIKSISEMTIKVFQAPEEQIQEILQKMFPPPESNPEIPEIKI